MGKKTRKEIKSRIFCGKKKQSECHFPRKLGGGCENRRNVAPVGGAYAPSDGDTANSSARHLADARCSSLEKACCALAPAR